MQSSFEIEPRSRAGLLAQKIREEIVRRGLPEGALFATEGQLCEIHSVSRSIVREAVSRLRTLGILRSVQRKGLVVGGGNPLGAFTRALPFFGRSSHANLGQLAELRYVLEVGAIELAVLHRTLEQAERLKVLADAFAAADADRNVDKQNRLDLEFHSLILEMTGNPTVAGMAGVLIEFFHNALINRSETRTEPRTVVQHHAIARGIAEQNIELLRVVIRQHLSNNLVIFREYQSRARLAKTLSPGTNGGLEREAG